MRYSFPTIYTAVFFMILIMPSFYFGESLGVLTSLLHYFWAFVGVIFIFYKKYKINYSVVLLALCFWLVAQFVLILTFIVSNTEPMLFSDIPSLFRPTFLFLMFFSAFVLLANNSGYHLTVLLTVLVSLMFVYNLFQLIGFSFFELVHKTFYFREKFEGRSVYVNFFFTSYATGYIALIPFYVSLSLFLSLRKKNFLFVFMISFSVLVMAQSKTMFFAAIIGLFMICFVVARSYFVKFIVLGIACFSVYVFYLNLEYVFVFLKEVGFRQAHSLELLFTDRSRSGTLNVRNEQILYSFEKVKEAPFFLGVGLGRNLYLESWVADSLYRYGFYGIGLFFAFVLFSSFWALKMLQLPNLRPFNRGIYLSFFVWAITLPVSQMSSPLHETGKTAALTMFFIGAVFAIREKDRFLNENKILSYNTSLQ